MGCVRYSKAMPNFDWSKWILVVDILTQIFLTSTLLNLRKVSICGGWFLCGVSSYVNFQVKPWRVINGEHSVSKIWVWMYTTNILLTPMQNSKWLAKTETLNADTSELIPKKNIKNFKYYIHYFPFFASKYFN